ncbi:MAG: ATP-binding protein [Flavobacteriales bacterium]|nr:ATP-binding protein [Flavobacteriales bacterium]
MIKIAVVGPESSGKTNMCEALALEFGCIWVKEYARAHLEERGPEYTEPDLLNIAKGQLLAESEAIALAERQRVDLIICDTDMITIRIWSEEVFGRCAPELIALSEQRHYDHWLLCRPDIPWESDPLRENPHDRDRLFDVYEAELKKLGKPCTIIEGGAEQRVATAVNAIDLISKS